MLISIKNMLIGHLLFVVYLYAFVAYEVPQGATSYVFAVYVVLVFILALVLNNNLLKAKFEIELLYLALGLFVVIGFRAIGGDSATFSYLLLILLSISLSFLFLLCYKVYTKQFKNCLKIFICFNIAGLYFQVLYFIAAGSVIDLHEFIYPFSEGKENILKGIQLPRFTGFYNEPGSYGTWMSVLILMLAYLERRFGRISFAAIISLPITLSVSSIIFFFVIIGVVFWKVKSNTSFHKFIAIFLALAGFVFFIIWYFSILDYLLWRFTDPSVQDKTTDFKKYAIQFFVNSSEQRIIFGSGLNSNDCQECESIQDVGLLFNMVFQTGIFSVLFGFVILLFYRVKNAFALAALIILLVSKIYVYMPLFWFTVLFFAKSNILVKARIQ